MVKFSLESSNFIPKKIQPTVKISDNSRIHLLLKLFKVIKKPHVISRHKIQSQMSVLIASQIKVKMTLTQCDFPYINYMIPFVRNEILFTTTW